MTGLCLSLQYVYKLISNLLNCKLRASPSYYITLSLHIQHSSDTVQPTTSSGSLTSL